VGHEIRVLGSVDVWSGGKPVGLPPQQAKVLAMLAAAPPGQGVTRADLVDGLWPSAPDGERLWAVVSKLRTALRGIGVTVSSGRGGAGYLLQPLAGPDGHEPAQLLDLTIVSDLVERAEYLLDAGEPVAAVRTSAEAAARWHGPPFAVGDDWPLPAVCRRAVHRIDRLRTRLARTWAGAGLLAGDDGALRWIDRDEEFAAGLDADRDVWLLRFVTALVQDGPATAEAMLEQRRPEWGYDDPMTARAAQLLELAERGAAWDGRAAGPGRLPAGADLDRVSPWLGSVRAGAGATLHIGGGADAERAAALQALVADAAESGFRVLHAHCEAADDLAPWRALLRDLWGAALVDPRFEPRTHHQLLADVVASPRPWSGRHEMVPELLDATVALLTAVARRRPLLVVLDDAHRLSATAAAVLDGVGTAVREVRAGIVLLGADTGQARRETEILIPVPDRRPPTEPDGAGDWLCAAAVTAVDEVIDTVLVARVLGAGVPYADSGLAAAVAGGLVESGAEVRFADPDTRQRVLAELAATPGRSRRLHAAAYRELATGPGSRAADPVRVARHALAARPEIPDDTVAAACLAAATAEQHAHRHNSAIEFAVRGLALTGDPALRFELQIVHGDSRHDRADLRAAETAYRAAYAEAGSSLARRATAVVRMARRWSDPGRIDESLLQMLRSTRDALGRAARSGVDETGYAELWLQVSSHLAHKSTMAVMGPGPEPPPGVQLAHTALAALTPLTPPIVACEVLTECRWALLDYAAPARIRAISERMETVAAASGSDHFRGEALIAALVDHLRLGDVAAGRDVSERHRIHVTRTEHGLGHWLQVTFDTLFDLWDGDLDAAERRVFGPLLQAVQQDRSDSLQQTWMGQVFWLRREQGRMSELLDYGIGRLAERRQYFPVWVAGMAWLHGVVGQRTAAVDQLLALLAQTSDLERLPPHGWSVATLALIAETIDSLGPPRSTDRLGLPALARRVDELLEPHTDELVLAGWPTVLLGPVRRARGLLALAAGDVDAAVQHFEDGIRTVGAPAQIAWLRHHQARALLARPSARRTARATELLAAALEVAEQKGMVALADATRREWARRSGAEVGA
jgi:hypothetical protein